MVAVDATPFQMGCVPTADPQCRPDEMPAHTVSVSAFQIDRTEVTREQFVSCVQASACDPPSCVWDCSMPGLPAGCIEWSQAKAYCKWVGKRLPTEAEWEKAARGTDGRKYPWGNDEPTCDRANMANCGNQAAAVGSRESGASPYGALDMAGNVVEMVADWYDAKFYATSPASDPHGPQAGTRYVGRGGGYDSEAIWQRTAARDWYDIADSVEALGFRCAQ
jgi:formylglycine-generating enzyme required for sulfatase activity